MSYKLKEQFKGFIVNKQIMGTGMVTFDTSKITDNNIDFFVEHIPAWFEEIKVEEEPKLKEVNIPLEDMTLSELREMYPNIKSNSKDKFIQKIWEEQNL